MSEVKTYKLSPEELLRYRLMDIKPYKKPCVTLQSINELMMPERDHTVHIITKPIDNLKPCQYCGKVIPRGKSKKSEYEKRKYCDLPCANRKKYNLPEVIPETKICKVCGKIMHKAGYISITAWIKKDTCTLLCGKRQGKPKKNTIWEKQIEREFEAECRKIKDMAIKRNVTEKPYNQL